jgi:hypothetical protein
MAEEQCLSCGVFVDSEWTPLHAGLCDECSKAAQAHDDPDEDRNARDVDPLDEG